MNEDTKIIEVKEEKVNIVASVTPNSTDVNEEIEDVVVQVATPLSLEIEDENLIDIEIEEAFPYLVSGVLDKTLGDKDVLIDAGIANVANNDETVGLQEVIEAAAAQGGSGGTVDHSLLNGREFADQHPITAISGLRDELDDIERVKRVYSSENGVSEFRKWHDENPKGENRSGYFVTIVPGTDEIEICDSTHDVYGVSVSSSGFVGNQDRLDKSDNYIYAMVGIVGAMRVRTDGTARVGEYVIPNQYGEATFSEAGYGYKVLSEGSNSSYQYIIIAVTPQSDALSRLGGSGSGSGDFGDIIIEINGVKDKIDDLEIKLDGTMSEDEIKDIVNENLGNIQTQVSNATDIANAAQASAQLAQVNASRAASTAAQAQQEAQSAAKEAISTANKAAADVFAATKTINEHTQGLATIQQQVTDNSTEITSITAQVTENGKGIAAVTQKVTDTETLIQHLTAYVDKYTIGEYSLSYGLTHKEAKDILTSEHIYIPTYEHTEIMKADTDVSVAFIPNYIYTWDGNTWVQSGGPISLATSYQTGEQNGDLWYIWNDDVEQLNDNGEVVDIYLSGTLYKWFDNKWVAVATTADNYSSRMITSVRQTADGIRSDVTNLVGDVTSVQQTATELSATVKGHGDDIASIKLQSDEIITTVGNFTEQLNGVNQQISSVQSGVADNASAISLINTGRMHLRYADREETPPPVYEGGNKYSELPVWNDELGIFVFNEDFVDNENGIYYFYSDDHTEYCKVVGDNSYEIYTIGNKVTSMIDSRVTETESKITEFNEFQQETSTTLTNVESKADANSASINSLAVRYYHPLIGVSENEVPMFGEYKYTKAPTWNATTGKYEFDINDRSDSGTYYLADEEAHSYCSVVTTGDGNTLYETYGLAGESLAAIKQEVDENKSSIGLVVERTKSVIDEDGNLTDEAITSKGSIIVEAINGQSTAMIDADKIQLTATDSITLALNGLEDKITLSDNKINLVVKDGAVSGSVLIEAINGESSAVINAERINLSSYSKTSDVKSLISTSIDGISLSVSNGTKSSTIKLMHDGVQIGSSGTIQFTGDVVFKSDLSTVGNTTINGANITTGTISADKIDTSSLYVKTVRINSDTSEAIILSSQIGVNDDVSIRLGVDRTQADSVGLNNDFVYQVHLYGDMIHFKATDGTGSSLTMRTDAQRVYSTGNWDLGSKNNPFNLVYARELWLTDKDGNAGCLYTTNGEKLYWYSERADDDALVADL